MCARFTIRKAKAITQKLRPDVVEADLSRPRYNVAPTQAVPVLLNRNDQKVLVDVRWGLVPAWAKDPTIGNKLINARAESVADKPSFRRSFRSKRCLIPADGFYEWKKSSE